MTGQLQPLHLSAECLWSKFGFGDGNPFAFEDRGQQFDDAPPHADWILLRETMDAERRDDLLELLVRRHLVPAIAAATGETPDLVRIGGHHNPVRDARLDHGNEHEIPLAWLEVGVDVDRNQVLEAAHDIMTRKP